MVRLGPRRSSLYDARVARNSRPGAHQDGYSPSLKRSSEVIDGCRSRQTLFKKYVFMLQPANTPIGPP